MSTSTEPWTDSRLAALRAQGDAEIDELLAGLDDMTRDEVIELYRKFVRAQLDLDPDLWPAELITWWNQPQHLPPWADEQKIARAAKFSEQWLPELLATYLLGSLPTAYAGSKGALALSRISLLGQADSLMRRVLETLLFVLRVNEHDGLTAGGSGVELARKTRVFHGLVRVMITRFAVDVRQPKGMGTKWDTKTDGVPVNQEDLLGTLWTFSITPLERIERAGATISDADKDAVVHLWCVVGHFLGIGASSSPPLLPMTYRDAAHCWSRIQEHQFGTSPQGKDLTEALIAALPRARSGPRLAGPPVGGDLRQHRPRDRGLRRCCEAWTDPVPAPTWKRDLPGLAPHPRRGIDPHAPASPFEALRGRMASSRAVRRTTGHHASAGATASAEAALRPPEGAALVPVHVSRHVGAPAAGSIVGGSRARSGGAVAPPIRAGTARP